MITCTNRKGIGQRLVLNLPGSPRAAYNLNQDKPTPALVHFWKTDFHLDCRNEVREVFTIRILYYTTLYYTILYYTILYYTILYYTILYYTMHTKCLSYQKTINPIGTLPGLLEQKSLVLVGFLFIYICITHSFYVKWTV